MERLPIELTTEIFKLLPPFHVLQNLRPICRRFSNASDILYPYGRLYGLPISIWAQILSVSDYFSILRVSITCISFQQLIQTSETPEILRVMFHEKLPRISTPVGQGSTDNDNPTQTTRPPEEYRHWELHPFLEGLRYSCSGQYFHAARVGTRTVRFWEHEDDEIFTPDENATSPPARTVIVSSMARFRHRQTNEVSRFYPIRPVRVSALEDGSGRGVSIEDVFKAVRLMFLVPMCPNEVLSAHLDSWKQGKNNPDSTAGPWTKWLNQSNGNFDEEFEEHPEILGFDRGIPGLEDAWDNLPFAPWNAILMQPDRRVGLSRTGMKYFPENIRICPAE
ncbi:hypothetical protein TWF506_004724 [Arthrobotrys conoides]|uniref:F-box domain-containing protein n=1 Tax=Arthrobotrys conoides TaxID=74498 RepID=A0AAN8NF93_9PEZI